MPPEVYRARTPLLDVVAFAGVKNYTSHFKARGLLRGGLHLHPAFALKREVYLHLREVK